MLNIGENLKKLRKEKGLSFRRLAKEIDISHNNLALYEKDLAVPSLENALKICKFFNVPLEYLLLGEKSSFNYNDFELAELSSEADKLEEEYRIMIKRYIKKVINIKKEKDKLNKELD